MSNFLPTDIAKLCYLSYLKPGKIEENFTNLSESNIISYNSKENGIENKCENIHKVLQKCADIPELYEGKYDCQVYLCNYLDNLIFVFRGTESKKDFFTNIQVSKTPFVLPNSYIWETPDVHSGFYYQFESVKSWILDKINLFLKSIPINSKDSLDNNQNLKKKKIIFTGHSLGGAIATLATLFFSYEYKDKIKESHLEIDCLTLGSPRVGDSSFASLFNKNVNNSYRYVNDNDPIPCFPSNWRFEHVKGLIWLNQNINYEFNSIWKIYVRFQNIIFDWFGFSYTPFQDHTCLSYILEIQNLD